MKLIISTILAMVVATAVSAQTYLVGSATGEVACMKAGKWTALSPRDQLSGKDIVRIGKNSMLSVIDKSANRLYSFGSQTEAPLENIIKNRSTVSPSRVASFIVTRLFRGDTEKISHNANVSYKDTNGEMQIYNALQNPSYVSSYPISMSLVNVTTGEEIGAEARMGSRFFFRITNDADKPLYINVLDLSSDGTMFDCLPIDEAGSMFHLLIPAQSTVDLTSYPMEFSEPEGTDRLTLIAFDKPFDLRTVIKSYHSKTKVSAPTQNTGLYSMSVTIRE